AAPNEPNSGGWASVGAGRWGGEEWLMADLSGAVKFDQDGGLVRGPGAGARGLVDHPGGAGGQGDAPVEEQVDAVVGRVGGPGGPGAVPPGVEGGVRGSLAAGEAGGGRGFGGGRFGDQAVLVSGRFGVVERRSAAAGAGNDHRGRLQAAGFLGDSLEDL